MTNIYNEAPSTVRLQFKKGELIVKEGDFGISVYKIIKGSVQIFSLSEEREITLAQLGTEELISEMAFLGKKIEVRAASARAIQDSELEVWHPDIISKEYDKMPLIIKYMTNEAQKRLARMNKFIIQMTTSKEEENEVKTAPSQKEQGSNLKRVHYRKDVDLSCTYRPVDSPRRVNLNGNIKNISLTGINMEVRANTVANFSHVVGDEFNIDFTLPNGKDVHITARIQALRKPKTPGTIPLGMAITNMREGSQKVLGFFLMP